MRFFAKISEVAPKGSLVRETITFDVDAPERRPLRSTMDRLLLERLDTSLEHLRVIFAGKWLTDPTRHPDMTFTDNNVTSKDSTVYVTPIGFHTKDSIRGAPFGICCYLDD